LFRHLFRLFAVLTKISTEKTIEKHKPSVKATCSNYLWTARI